MAMVICMASAKGGSGKTVLTATFSAFLVALGKRVLMIDTDSATNGLTLMFLKETMMQSDVAVSERRIPRGIYEGVSKGDQPEIVKVSTGAHLVPATYSFTNTELISSEQFEISLQRTLETLNKDYDFIFLDAQAGADSIAHIAMSQKYSNQVVIVSEYDPLSAAGVERLKGLFREDLTYVRTWILLNKMLPDFVQSFSDFMEVAKYASPIPWDADVVRAYARRRLALDLEKGNEFTLAVVQTLRSILGDEIGVDLDNWLQSRTAALREPIETQYQDAERELESLIREYRLTTFQRSSKQLRWQVITVTMSAAIALGAAYVIRYFLWLRNPGILGLTLSILFIPTLFGLYRFVRMGWGESIDTELTEARFRRHRETLQDRLKMLEALKSADAAALLKIRGSSGMLGEIKRV
jgi:cellulose biosynthesis protein BcsQ